MPDLLALHALIGTDTLAAIFGIAKIKTLKVARTARLPLHSIGDTQTDEAIVLEKATLFILACYGKGSSGCASMSEARIKMWRKKTGIGAALKLCCLPPRHLVKISNLLTCRIHTGRHQLKAQCPLSMP